MFECDLLPHSLQAQSKHYILGQVSSFHLWSPQSELDDSPSVHRTPSVCIPHHLSHCVATVICLPTSPLAGLERFRGKRLCLINKRWSCSQRDISKEKKRFLKWMVDGGSLTWPAEEEGGTHFIWITRLFVEHIWKELLPRLITENDIIVQY